MIPTERHLRAARALAGMSQADLAKAAGISGTTMSRMETFGGLIGHHPSTKRKIEVALKKAGVVVTDRGVYLAD